MKKLITILAATALVAIPATYLIGARGGGSGGRSFGGGHARSGRSFTSGPTGSTSVRTGVARTSSVASTGVTSTGVTRTSATRLGTRSTASQLSTRTGTKIAGAHHGGRRGGRGGYWRYRRGFRGYPGNFWSLGIGYPWWWYDTRYQHICVDEFGFEIDPAFCNLYPRTYFWWYR